MASLKKLSKPRPPDTSTMPNGSPMTGPKPDTIGPNMGNGRKK